MERHEAYGLLSISPNLDKEQLFGEDGQVRSVTLQVLAAEVDRKPGLGPTYKPSSTLLSLRLSPAQLGKALLGDTVPCTVRVREDKQVILPDQPQKKNLLLEDYNQALSSSLEELKAVVLLCLTSLEQPSSHAERYALMARILDVQRVFEQTGPKLLELFRNAAE